jgi:hypothetical protein
MKEGILAVPWDVIVCPNNHPCYLAVKTVRWGDDIKVDQFWAIGGNRQPTVGETLLSYQCKICGERTFNFHDSLGFRYAIRTLRTSQRGKKPDEEDHPLAVV